MRGRCEPVPASRRRASRWSCSARPRSPDAGTRAIRTETCAATSMHRRRTASPTGETRRIARHRPAHSSAGRSGYWYGPAYRYGGADHRRLLPALRSFDRQPEHLRAAASARAVTRIRRAGPDAARASHAARRLGGAMRKRRLHVSIRSAEPTGTSRGATASPPTRSTRSKRPPRSSMRAVSTPPRTSSSAAAFGARDSAVVARARRRVVAGAGRVALRPLRLRVRRPRRRRSCSNTTPTRRPRCSRLGRPVALDAAGRSCRRRPTRTSSIRCTRS